MAACLWPLMTISKTGKKIFGCAILIMPPNRISPNTPGCSCGSTENRQGTLGLSAAQLPVLSSKKKRERINRDNNGPKLTFESKLKQAAAMITSMADVFALARILVVTDSWFGNNGLFKPLQNQLGRRVDLLSRLRSNNNVFELPGPQGKRRAGRPRKYGAKLGTAASLAAEFKSLVAYERVVMLKTICQRRYMGSLAV